MNRKQICVLVGATLLASSSAVAREFYVNGAGSAGTQNGSRDFPFRTIQAAVAAADDGDEVRVAQGTYNENVRIEDKDIQLLGGFNASWQRAATAVNTELTGLGDNAAINIIESDAVVDGFRIAKGTGSVEELPFTLRGGGIYIRGGSPTISNNLIEDNELRGGNLAAEESTGGGIYVTNAVRATIRNNVIRNNEAGRGAGIAVNVGVVIIEDNTIENNVGVGDHGGGLFITAQQATITRNIIRGNEIGRELGYGWGGGLIVAGVGSEAELSLNTVYENFAASFGSGEFIDEGAVAEIHHELIYNNRSSAGCEAVSAIYVDGGAEGGSSATIDHCTVVNNMCENSTRGNGLQVEGDSTVTVSNSIFWGNAGDDFQVIDTSTLVVTYTCSEEGYAGTGNISSNPRFRDEAASDFRLAANSPCIDAADPAAPFDKEPADNGGRADLGRFGNTANVLSTPDDGGNENENRNANDNAAGNANSNDNRNGNDNGTPDDGTDGPIAAAACPMTAMLLMSLSLVGVCRTRRTKV
ncbi:MAG: right-handed parallel beta-helix repeat-containing protein [Phycisphaerae bacterium]